MDCSEPDCKDKKSHGILACPVRLDKFSLVNTKVINNVNVQNVNRMRAVALPTAMVQLESPVKDASLKSTSILLDTGAQQSLISRKVVEALQIKIVDRVYTALVGFDSSKPKPKYYDIVRLTLYKPGFAGKARVTALVIDHSPSVCTMAGIFNFAKKLHKLGLICTTKM